MAEEGQREGQRENVTGAREARAEPQRDVKGALGAVEVPQTDGTAVQAAEARRGYDSEVQEEATAVQLEEEPHEMGVRVREGEGVDQLTTYSGSEYVLA